MHNKLTLEDQSEKTGWPISRIKASRVSARKWSLGSVLNSAPEIVVAACIEAEGEKASWCEGGSINLLVKASALDVLTELNLFHDRQDAVRRKLEAQLSLVNEHKEKVLARIASVEQVTLNRNIDEILLDPFVRTAYPRVSAHFLQNLASTVTPELLRSIASLLFENPYDYRSGWPDLTIIGRGLRFVEVKTTDLLHESQLRFATDIAKPLGLNCEIVQVCKD